MAYSAKMIKDSISSGFRLTTMELTHPRIVHAEFMTHCSFARNASSSRAIPFKKMVVTVVEDPFIPVWWGKNEPGMKAKEELAPEEIEKAKVIWLAARDSMVHHAGLLASMGLHKQICNRLLEPFGWITVCVTGDPAAWSNYFALRCHPDAQPEIEKQAKMALGLYLTSVPTEVKVGCWHLPYFGGPEDYEYMSANNLKQTDAVAISIGRCARTSLLTQDGKRDPAKDVELHDRLREAKPIHASPFEHVAEAMGYGGKKWGKYAGWRARRHTIHGEMTTDYFERLKQ